MKTKTTHYRVPSEEYKGQVRGKPSRKVIHLYHRGHGFAGVSGFKGDVPMPRGGLTFYDIYEDGIIVTTGVSVCSYADNFNYHKGRLIAKGRAEKKYSNRKD